jgi:catechol-2,3-dioxygenase
MLGKYNVMAHVAVKDLTATRKFYEQTLGLQVANEDHEGITYTCGNSKLYVYQSAYGATNQATGASWGVDDINQVVEDLKTNGVTFERYDIPNATYEGDVHVMGEYKAAWFKDPEGNILAIDQV